MTRSIRCDEVEDGREEKKTILPHLELGIGFERHMRGQATPHPTLILGGGGG